MAARGTTASYISATSYGTAAFVTASHTPDADSYVYYAVFSETSGDGLITNLSITDSIGSTFTLVGAGPANMLNSDFSIEVVVYRTTTGSSPAARTVSVNADNDVYHWKVVRTDVSDVDTTDPEDGFVRGLGHGTFGTFDGARSVTLTETPAADDVILAYAVREHDPGTASVTPSASFTEIHDDSSGGTFLGTHAQARTGTTSTTVDWVDTHVGSVTLYQGPAVLAFIVKDNAGGGTTEVEGDDTGAGAEGTGAVTATLERTDTGSGSDAATALSASLSRADSGSGADSATVAASQAWTDSGSGTDEGTASAAVSGSESGSGAEEDPTVEATLARTDTGAGVDAGTIFVQLTVTDSGSGVEEAVEILRPIDVTETGSGAEGDPTIAATLARTDSATATESATVTVTQSVTDTGTGTDEDGTVDFGNEEFVEGDDSFTTTELATVSAIVYVTESATAEESLGSRTFSVYDSGTTSSELARGPRGKRKTLLQLVTGRA
jgi:hypothetical protein